MRQILFIYITCLFCLHAKAQPGKEAWHWRFGSMGGLDFSSGVPVQESSPFYLAGGSASISDKNTGQYLFTVGGNKIYNKNNVIMPNGAALFTTINSTQADLIVPSPVNSKIYYVFTVDQAGSTNKGVNYSIVDLSLSGGLGAVTVKNYSLTPAGTTEKLTAVRNCSGTNYWILTHPYNSNSFNAYLLNSAGVNLIPVVSSVGTVHQNLSSGYLEATGYLKASPNGQKLALGICSDSIRVLEIFDFDNSTGIVSNPITISYPKKISGPYGLSFSPDNSKLYTCVYPNDSLCRIYQYDLSSGIPASIIASQTQIFQTSVTFKNSYGRAFNAMQLGPDSRVYIACTGIDTLSVINNPNNIGTSCNFQINGPVMPNNGAKCVFGLPNFIDANYAGIQLNIPDIQQCNTFTVTTLNAGSGFTNYFWSTGASTQTITVNSPGKYWVTVTNTQGCTKTDTINAYLLKPLKYDTLVCDTFHANVTQGGVLAYNWYDNNNNPIRNFTQSGNYYVDINYVSGCAIRDSIKLKVVPSPKINLGRDTAFCKGNLILNAQNPSSTYIWSTGATSPAITATEVGIYWVKVTDANGCKAKDTIIIHPQFSAFDFAMPNIVTPNNDNINDVIDFGVYQFSSLQLEIFNRWGTKIFENSDPKCIWKPSGEDGTYFYTAQYRIDCGTDTQTKNIKGFITVVK